jgi:type II secretory pathway component GspD/PulD (secretin)
MKSMPTVAKLFVASALAALMAAPSAFAQAPDTQVKQPDACASQAGSIETKTFILANTSGNSRISLDGSEILGTLRHVLCPLDKVELVNGQNTFVIQAPPADLVLAKRLIEELDRPKKTYRLTYTITELDSGKSIGTQHYSMVLVTGQRTTMKQGDKIPVATGSYSPSGSTASAAETQFTYLDVGMNFDATLEELANDVRLQSKVEQSSVGPSNTIAGVQEPVVRQTVLEGTSFLTVGKPVMLGSIDVPNSTHHFDIAVVMDQVK